MTFCSNIDLILWLIDTLGDSVSQGILLSYLFFTLTTGNTLSYRDIKLSYCDDTEAWTLCKQSSVVHLTQTRCVIYVAVIPTIYECLCKTWFTRVHTWPLVNYPGLLYLGLSGRAKNVCQWKSTHRGSFCARYCCSNITRSTKRRVLIQLEHRRLSTMRGPNPECCVTNPRIMIKQYIKL